VSEASKVARSLSEAQREALPSFCGQWIAGPSLPDGILAEIGALREAGLLDREFMDEGPPVHFVGDCSLTIKLSACWHFSLSPLGQQVRAYLETNPGGTADPAPSKITNEGE
jgi:hypothetical protein